MIKTEYLCDWCKTMNGDNQEFANEVVLIAGGGTERNWHVCPDCLQKVIDYITNNLIK